jgi:hypothetical protein
VKVDKGEGLPVLTPDFETRIRFCRWFQESVCNGLIDPELKCFNEA